MKFATFERQAELIIKRVSDIKVIIEKTIEEGQTMPNVLEKLGFYQEEAKSKYNQFNEALDSLMSQDKIDDYNEETLISYQDKISDLFISIKMLTEKYFPKPNATSNSEPQNSVSHFKLPALSLKPFNGSPDQWLSFFSLFEASVDKNSNLNDVEKMQYLLTSLHGEPLSLIKNLPIAPGNYVIGWNILKQRYQNSRKIISYHVNNVIELPNVNSPSQKNLRSFISHYQENVQALLTLNHDIEKDNIILASLLLRKLDSETRKKFEDKKLDSQVFPKAKEIIDFLESECAHMEAAEFTHNTSTSRLFSQSRLNNKPCSKSERFIKPRPEHTSLLSSASETLLCNYCGDNGHTIYKCSNFQNLTTQNKFDFVKKKHFCFNCLGSSHSVKECKSKKLCSTCNKKHHTWLHLPKTNESLQAEPLLDSLTSENLSRNDAFLLDNSQRAVVAFSQEQNSKPTTILLGTTLVHVSSCNGNSLVLRAVVDSGSMITCISESAARLLSLKRCSDLHGKVDGLSSCQVKTKGVSRISISSLSGTQVAPNHQVVIIDKITSNLPHYQVPLNVKDKFKNLVLADPTFDTPSSVNMLLGADLFAKVVTGERLIISENIPSAMNSVFGYIIIGSTPIIESTCDSTGITTLLSTNDLHLAVQRFWTQEEPPFKMKLTPEEEFCESHFCNTHSRDSTGRYIVRLPLKLNHPPLGDSAEGAKRRFLALEKRFNNNPDLKVKYTDCMRDYIESGDAELVETSVWKETKHFFLPHHAVIKEESSSTKVRVVFDASATSSSGVSLNEILLSGPKLQNEISDILVYFRCYSVICCSDIKQMFRRIIVHNDDRNYQLFFWREDSSKPLCVYRFTTVVFGFSSSPFLAIRTLKQLVKDEGHNYPLAAQAIDKQIYVDDLILGADSLENAIELQTQAIQLLEKGGFYLRKWTSNCAELVNNVPESHREKPVFYHDSEYLFYNVLGIKWISQTDEFTYHLNLNEYALTKRKILSTVAQIYDVCGWITPVILWAKAFLQVLWTLGLQWDDTIPCDLAEKWNKFFTQIPCLNALRIPRYLFLQEATSIQLHGFSDGSEMGYGAAVYVRCVLPDKSVKVFLLMAKSRVAPLKRISIPRLELCGAHILSKLLHHCHNLLSERFNVSSIQAWSDSTVVLSWIQTPPYRLKVYVANRVSQIQDLIPTHCWHHVSTSCNPADCASRGILPSSILDHNLWWQGPSWLRHPEEEWPDGQFTPTRVEDLLEVKPDPLPILVAAFDQVESDFLKRFSSWSTLLRVVAFVLRFIDNCKGKERTTGFLTLQQLDRAKSKVCHLVQQESFMEDLSRLRSEKPCTSRLSSLSPFIDKDGLIRVGGRIKHSTVPFQTRHPIILPKSHHITNLVIDYHHNKYLHAGPHFLQSAISREFWIISSRSAIRSRIYRCVRCFRCKPKAITQKMGDLPPARVTPSRVFQNCGTDFLGPYMVKPNSLRKASPRKVYLCVFICFAVKAVHIEVVSDLTSEAFLAALTRFVSRRGLCSNIYCDCGTNFVGASTELKKIINHFFNQEETQQSLNRYSNENNIKFHFLPPAAPHQGGLWERAVRSIKHHLVRVIGEQILTFEEFLTLSVRVEAILNSRPLTPLSSDPTEIDCLTPGHFLVGGPLFALPEYQWKDTPSNRLSRWQLVQSLGQSLWKRWKDEYLHTLQERGKWRSPQENIRVGDLVVIHEQNSSPLSWRLGRVTATSPGNDGLVRVVELRTATGSLSRPITKISPLPVEQ